MRVQIESGFHRVNTLRGTVLAAIRIAHFTETAETQFVNGKFVHGHLDDRWYLFGIRRVGTKKLFERFKRLDRRPEPSRTLAPNWSGKNFTAVHSA